jgi:hypothetical protein
VLVGAACAAASIRSDRYPTMFGVDEVRKCLEKTCMIRTNLYICTAGVVEQARIQSHTRSEVCTTHMTAHNACRESVVCLHDERFEFASKEGGRTWSGWM